MQGGIRCEMQVWAKFLCMYGRLGAGKGEISSERNGD